MSDQPNPFASMDGHAMAIDAATRLDMVRDFNLEECRAALHVRGLQKTVEKKIQARIRRLEREEHRNG